MTLTENSAHEVEAETRFDRARKILAGSDDATKGYQANTDIKNIGLKNNRRINTEKVARIKAALATGEYEIDPTRIVDKIVEHDRNR